MNKKQLDNHFKNINWKPIGENTGVLLYSDTNSKLSILIDAGNKHSTIFHENSIDVRFKGVIENIQQLNLLIRLIKKTNKP